MPLSGNLFSIKDADVRVIPNLFGEVDCFSLILLRGLNIFARANCLSRLDYVVSIVFFFFGQDFDFGQD